MALDILESNFSFLCNSTAYHRDLHSVNMLPVTGLHYKVARCITRWQGLKNLATNTVSYWVDFFFLGLISIILSEFWLIYDRMFITSTLNLRPFFNQISTQIIKIVDNQCMTLSKKNNT